LSAGHIKQYKHKMNTTNLSDIAFEQIHDTYHRGRYGEFDVIIRLPDGYINVTKLCAKAESSNGTPKKFFNWKKAISSDELIAAASRFTGIPVDQLTEVVLGGTHSEISGTYAHPKLVPHIASWASSDFAMQVSDIVNAAMVRKHVQKIREQARALAEKDGLLAAKDDNIAELKAMLNRMDAKMDNTNEKLDTVSNELHISHEKLDIQDKKLDNLTEIVTDAHEGTAIVEHKIDDLRTTFPERLVPRPIDPAKEQTLILTRVGRRTYKLTRCQVGSKSRSLSKLANTEGHTEATVVYERNPCANPGRVSLIAMEALRANPHVNVRYQTITLRNRREFSEHALIRTFAEAANQEAEAMCADIAEIKTDLTTIQTKLVV
jgi:KilA-N domain